MVYVAVEEAVTVDLTTVLEYGLDVVVATLVPVGGKWVRPA